MKYLNKEIKNNEWIIVIKYILSNFTGKNIKIFLPENNKNSTTSNCFDNINKKTKLFNDFPLNFNPPNLWTLDKNLNFILDEQKEYKAERFAAKIKLYSHTENKIFYKLNKEDEKSNDIQKLINNYNN